MARIIKYSQEAKQLLKNGIEKVFEAVKVTLGPNGKCVVLDVQNEPLSVSDDGVTVAKHIILKDEVENTGAKFLIEAAFKTNEIAGDGTTTAIILSHALINEGLKQIANGKSPTSIKENLKKISNMIAENLNKISKPISTFSDILHIATISSNNEKIGKLIADGFKKVGKTGILAVDDIPSDEMKIEITEGSQFPKGYISPYFINNPQRATCELNKPDILVTDLKITTIDEILPLLQKLNQYNRKELLIFADSIEGEALSLLILNKLKNVFNAVAVQAPGYGALRKDLLKDIAIITGATLITKEAGQKLDEVTLDQLGSAKKVIIYKDKTIIIGGKGSKTEVLKHQEDLKKLLSLTKNQNEAEKLKDRIGNLTGKIGVIRVEAATESELQNKKFKIEDAINATKAAIEEGVVIGGGIALLKALNMIPKEKLNEDELTAYKIIEKAIEEPIKIIAENSEVNGDIVLKTIKESKDENLGFNAEKRTFENLLAAGVIDPLKVVKTAIKNAISITSLFLTTEVAIVDEIKEKTYDEK